MSVFNDGRASETLDVCAGTWWAHSWVVQSDYHEHASSTVEYLREHARPRRRRRHRRRRSKRREIKKTHATCAINNKTNSADRTNLAVSSDPRTRPSVPPSTAQSPANKDATAPRRDDNILLRGGIAANVYINPCNTRRKGPSENEVGWG